MSDTAKTGYGYSTTTKQAHRTTATDEKASSARYPRGLAVIDSWFLHSDLKTPGRHSGCFLEAGSCGVPALRRQAWR